MNLILLGMNHKTAPWISGERLSISLRRGHPFTKELMHIPSIEGIVSSFNLQPG